MQKKQQEHFDDSYDQAKLSSLKQEISLSKTQLFQLVNDDDKFHDKLKNFNQQAFRCIECEQFYEAIVYLSEAELTLEYGASCGKTIDRALILTILHNLACVYQRIWELQKSADYIQGIIYNITTYLESDDKAQLCQQMLEDKSIQTQKLSNILHNRFKLVTYYLQFCAVNSQLKRHENSLNAASKSLDILKEICEQQHEYQTFMGIKYHNELQKAILLQLRNIKDFKDEVDNIDKNLQRFMNKAKKSINMFQKKIKFSSELLDFKQIQQLQQFSIGSVMQIFPMAVWEVVDWRWIKEELTPLHKIYKALYISIAHFTMATELRLIATNLYPIDQNIRKTSTEFKCSQLHHLISIITVALYVPYETIYFQHILNSHKNHYQTDLTQISQSTLSEELSNQVEPDDEIHLQISSLYRKKNKEDIQESSHYKGSGKMTISNSPSMHQVKKKSQSRGKIKSSKVSWDSNSVQQKCRMITDSQKNKFKGKSKVKLGSKKSKSKKKIESRNRESMNSPVSHKKITSVTNLNSVSQIPAGTTSRSKSKKKRQSGGKPSIQSVHEKSREKLEKVRSEQEYCFTKPSQNGYLMRTNKAEKDKKSLKNSQRNSQLKRSGAETRNTDVRFIRQGRSPNAIPRPVK